MLCCVCGVLGHLAPVHRSARLLRCFACAVSWATWLLLTGVPARRLALPVRCPVPLGPCSPVCLLGALLCVCGVLGHLAPVQRCAHAACCFSCAVSWATWHLFTGVLARHVALRLRCPRRLGSCSPVCPRGVLFCLCGVLGHLAPIHSCAREVRCFACAVSWATWLLFTGVPAWCVACLCGVLGHLAPVHQCARLVCCFACAVSRATWHLLTGVPARCVVLCVQCPGPLGSCSPVCPLAALLRVCGVLGHLAPVHRCARSAPCFACAVFRATWLLFTGVPARCVAPRVRCPGPLGSCSPVCPRGVLFCLCRVLGHLAPVHRCARAVRCFACAVSWATWLLFTGVPAWCVACVCGVRGHLAPVHRCARSVCCFACAVSWATWLLFSGLPTRCVVLRVWCPGPPGSCSLVCPLGVLLCVCVSLATWLLFTVVPTRCVLLRVQCLWPLGSCSPVRSPGTLCGALGPLASVYWCARLVCWAVGCVCGPSLRGPHSFIRTVAIRSRQGRGTLRACTRLSRQRLFVAGRGWVPSRRTHVHPDGGCSIAGRGWVRCRGRTRLFGRQLVLLGTCPRAVVRCVLCARSGFAAPSGRCSLAPVRVPWLWPAA